MAAQDLENRCVAAENDILVHGRGQKGLVVSTDGFAEYSSVNFDLLKHYFRQGRSELALHTHHFPHKIRLVDEKVHDGQKPLPTLDPHSQEKAFVHIQQQCMLSSPPRLDLLRPRFWQALFVKGVQPFP